MKNSNEPAVKAAELRRAAEERCRSRSSERDQLLGELDTQRLVHELQVHQIELEMQNEELRRAQAEVEKGLQQLTELFEFALVGYFRLDAAGVIHELNLAAAAMLGSARALLVGQRLQRFLAGTDRPVLAAFLARVFASETPHLCDLELRPASGRAVFVQLSGKRFPEMADCLVAVIDLTERKRAEQALRNSEARYRSLVEQASDAIIIADAEGWCQDVNHSLSAMTGYSRDELLRLHLRDLVSHEEAARIAPELAALTAETPHLQEWHLRRKDGTTFPVEVNAGRLPDGRAMGMVRDITERKRVEAELQASRADLARLSRQLIATQENERRHLARELHDEIGQVLTAVFYDLNALQATHDPVTLSRLDDSLAVVTQAIQQVRNLSLDLRPSMLDDFGLAPTVRWCAERLAQRSGLTLHLTAPPAGVDLPADVKNACFRVAQEALTNVARHARAKQVWIELLQSDAEVSLVIRDDGLGFDVAAARRRAVRGDSVGLLGMQERVELIGGQFTMESAPGQGTTLRVHFDLEELAEKSAESGPCSAGK